MNVKLIRTSCSILSVQSQAFGVDHESILGSICAQDSNKETKSQLAKAEIVSQLDGLQWIHQPRLNSKYSWKTSEMG